MHGKVMARLRGHFWGLPGASLRGLRIRVIGSEEVTVAIVVVGAGEEADTVHDRRHHRLLSSRCLIAGRERSLCCLIMLWR